MKAIVTIIADNGDLMSKFEVQPRHIEDCARHTEYVYDFVYSVENMESERSIPCTETHIVTQEDIKLAYNRGYMEGLKRGMVGG